MKKILTYFKGDAKKVFNITLLSAFAVIFLSADMTEKNMGSSNSVSPEWNQFATVSQQDSVTVGIPVQGDPGITETVQEIMDRESVMPQDYYPKAREHVNPEMEETEYEIDAQNPNSPETSQWPPLNKDQKNAEPNQTDNPQTVGTSFLAMNVSVSGFIPPDTQGDVGPTQVLTVSNGRIRVYSKAGVLGGLNSDLDVFFNSVRNGAGTTDPHIRYDRLSGRWFVVAINVQAAPNRVLIAVSSGSTITNAASFTFYQFTENLTGAINGFADYPTLGVDKNALYIGMNMFNAAGTSFLGCNGYVVNKANLIGGSLTTTAFTFWNNGVTVGPYTPQGVDNDDPSATEGYFIGVNGSFYGSLIVRRVTTPGGVPALSANLTVTTPTTTAAINVPCLGTSAPGLDPTDWRLFAAMIHKNKISGAITLWTAHHFQVNASGVADGTGGRQGNRWYEISNLTTTPVLVQSGTMYDPAASNPRSFLFPSCAMSGQGHMAIGSSIGGTGTRAESIVAGRYRTDALGTQQAFTLAQSSSTAYNLIAGDGRIRWGDYSQTVVDPSDDMTMWTFQEYCDANNSWGVRAIQLKSRPPATPSASSITDILAGQPSVNIVITGTSVSGSEFFDPGADAGGPGFTNHIAASISGTVTVNSVTFTDPTHVTLNISTVGSPAGLKNITVTNPDGQTATGNNLINITTVSPPPCEDFTSVTFPPAPLTVDFTGTNYWSRALVSAYGTGTGSAKFAFYDAGPALPIVQSLVSNNFTNTVANTYLTFDEAYAPYGAGFGPDTLLVEASNNLGGSYSILATLIGKVDGTGELNSAPATVSSFTPDNTQWRPKIYSLPVGTNKVRLRAKSGYGNNLYIDNLCVQTLAAPVSGFLGVTPQGFYRGTPSIFNGIGDTVTIYLHRADLPNIKVDSTTLLIDAFTTTTPTFSRALSGTYYFEVRHRNSIETWSKAGGEAYSRGSIFSFDFLQVNAAFNNNQYQVNVPNNLWGMFGGDIDRNGFVDLSDITQVYNDASAFVTGYVITDVTGDNITDLNDIILTYNNSSNFVTVQRPAGAEPEPAPSVKPKDLKFENDAQRRKYEKGIRELKKSSVTETVETEPNWIPMPAKEYLNRLNDEKKRSSVDGKVSKSRF